MTSRRHARMTGPMLTLMLMLPGAAGAQLRSNAVQAAAEFTCGSNANSFAQVAPGDYTTTIPVINLSGGTIDVKARVALSSPVQRESDPLIMQLAPGQAAQLDCDDILDASLFPTPLPGGLPDDDLAQGYVRIVAENLVDVRSIQTLSASVGESSIAVTVPPVHPIRLPRGIDRGKTTLCHRPPGNTSNEHTLQVGDASVPAHLAHGDSLGACDDG